MKKVYKVYGPEWQKELMQFTKKELIVMFRRICIKNREYKRLLNGKEAALHT